MTDTFRAMIQRVEDAKGKTVTTEVELVSYVKERSTGNSEARYYVNPTIRNHRRVARLDVSAIIESVVLVLIVAAPG